MAGLRADAAPAPARSGGREVGWADVVVFDDVLGMGTWAQELRRSGKRVVGGRPYTDRRACARVSPLLARALLKVVSLVPVLEAFVHLLS